MEHELDYLPVVVDEVRSRRWRTSTVRRWLKRARQELEQRVRDRAEATPATVSRTYLHRWRAVQESSHRELQMLAQALDVVEACCCDGHWERLGRALLLYDGSRQAFQDYCKKRTAMAVNPAYLAA